MMTCNDICLYYQTFETFAPNRTYETHKRCTTCNHIVEKAEFPDSFCYCCAAKYRDRFPKSVQGWRQKNRKRNKTYRQNNNPKYAITA